MQSSAARSRVYTEHNAVLAEFSQKMATAIEREVSLVGELRRCHWLLDTEEDLLPALTPN